MGKYLFLQSRDPFECRNAVRDHEIAMSLAAGQHDVAVFLVQNGVLAAREAARGESIQRVLDSGVRVVSDDFSLRERAVSTDALRPGVEVASLDLVVDEMTAGTRVVWW